MLAIRVGKDIVAFTGSFPKALAYVAHLAESNIAARIDSSVPESVLDRREYMQLLMDDYASRQEG